MKIPSTKIENQNQQMDLDLSTANTSSNAALFDQLFQFLLMQMPVLSNTTDAVNTPADANEITSNQKKLDANKINNFANLLSAAVNGTEDSNVMNKKMNDISTLMQQIEQNGNTLNYEDISAALKQILTQSNQPANQLANKQADKIDNQLSTNQVDEKLLDKIVNTELNATTKINNQVKENIEKTDILNLRNNLQSNNEVKTPLIQQPNDAIELNAKQVNLDNVSFNVKSVNQKSAKSHEENKSNSTIVAKDNFAQITLNSMSSDSNKLSNAPIDSYPSTIDVGNKVKNTNNNKYLDAFVNLGQLINNHTLPVDNRSQLANQVPADAKMAESQHFDPQHDVKFEIMTEKTLHPNQLSQQVYDAKIKIYPPELGHVIAKLKVEKNNAELIILTENSQVKQIVESNLPLLKQHFQNSDINLVQIDVQTAQTGGGESNKNQEDKPQHLAEQQLDQSKAPNRISKSSNKSESAIIDTYA